MARGGEQRYTKKLFGGRLNRLFIGAGGIRRDNNREDTCDCTQNLIFGFQFLFVVSLYFVGNFYAFSSYWIFALMVISLFFVYQSHLAKNNEYLSAFKNNNLVGMILCLFLLFEIYFIQ